MKQIIVMMFLVVLAACSSGESAPSEGARGMAGAEGVFEFKPEDWRPGETSWWEDSDGIDPGTPGCHIGTDSEGNPNGRMFGEACLDEVHIVESNPGEDVLHSHENDVGHPDKFNCNDWCIAQGASGGMCEVAAAPPCEASARCACQ